MGSNAAIPYFDPWDGGVDAKTLFLLEAPGPKARNSGFVSMNNPDETARNFFEIYHEVGFRREETATWNVVPWYIGSGAKIRAANSSDLAQGKHSLRELFGLMPELRAVVLMGRKAQKNMKELMLLVPDAAFFQCPHPSPMYVNRKKENKGVLLASLEEVRAFLDGQDRV